MVGKKGIIKTPFQAFQVKNQLDQKSLHYPVSKPCRVMVWQAKTNLYCGTIAVYQLYFIN
ncbi:hypothetical protein CHK_0360 [Christensenella hongkongensis]|uniref:Uncharacterized protein n=1 Tax=Christensenella hongkongensis TaxID=270498 RepID=A0A0M2NMC3_9FIRM|nr:hypothetical protein CHK_0360 [Christensenella hongkongensis]